MMISSLPSNSLTRYVPEYDQRVTFDGWLLRGNLTQDEIRASGDFHHYYAHWDRSHPIDWAKYVLRKKKEGKLHELP
jgi:hypothetical protein